MCISARCALEQEHERRKHREEDPDRERRRERRREHEVGVKSLVLRVYPQVPSKSPFVVSCTSDLFTVTCDQNHETVFNPLLNGEKQ